MHTDPSDTGLGPSSNQRRIIRRGDRATLWPIVAIVAYAIVFVGSLAFMMVGTVIAGEGDDELFLFVLAIVASMLVLAALLLIAPVRVATRRPVTRSSLWPALFAGGFIVAALVVAGGFAVLELIAEDDAPEVFMIALAMGACAVWVTWAVVFYIQSAHAPVASVAFRLYTMLIRGSVVELIVAVSCHLVVRKRTECSAGVLTTLGILTGAAAMLLAFGPALLILYMQRARSLRPNLRLADVNPNPQRPSALSILLWLILIALLVVLAFIVADDGWITQRHADEFDPPETDTASP